MKAFSQQEDIRPREPIHLDKNANLAIRVYGHPILRVSSHGFPFHLPPFQQQHHHYTLLTITSPAFSARPAGLGFSKSPSPTCIPSTKMPMPVSANRDCCIKNAGSCLTASINHLYSKNGGRVRIWYGSKTILASPSSTGAMPVYVGTMSVFGRKANPLRAKIVCSISDQAVHSVRDALNRNFVQNIGGWAQWHYINEYIIVVFCVIVRARGAGRLVSQCERGESFDGIH